MNFINKLELKKDIWGAPDGVASLVLAQLASRGKPLVYVARDDARLSFMRGLLEIGRAHV